MGFKKMYVEDWANSFGYKSFFSSEDGENKERQEANKNFQMNAFLGDKGHINNLIYIKSRKSLQPLNLSGSPVGDAFAKAIESLHSYGGIIPTKKDVNKGGFNFYSPDKEEKIFVGFNDLETIIQLEVD